MAPRFTNPHVLATKPASRAQIFAADAEDPSTIQDSELSKRKLQELEQILRESLGDFHIPHEPKRKRRRLAKDEDKPSDDTEPDNVLPFRLVSSTLEAKPVILYAKESTIDGNVVKERLSEDTAVEAELRRARAASIAVDSDWVLSHCREPYLAPPQHRQKSIDFKMVALPSPSPTMMVTERTRPWPSPPTLHPGRSIPPDAVKAPGLHVKLANCPIISAESPTNRPISHLTRNQRRRRQKRVSTQTRTEKLRPMFWRPSLGMGVKSRGYAMGFEGSYVRLDEREVMEGRYVRDTMRKAVLVNWQAR